VEKSNIIAAQAIMRAVPHLVQDLHPLQPLLMENIVRMNSAENKENILTWARFPRQARPPDAFIIDSSLEFLDLLKPELFTPEDAKIYLTQAMANQSWTVAAVLLLSMKELTVKIDKKQKRQIVDACLELLSNKIEQNGKTPETDQEVEMIMQRKNALGILFHQAKDIIGLMFTTYNDEKNQKTTLSVRRLLNLYNGPESEIEKKYIP
jgi:hypothetical protein